MNKVPDQASDLLMQRICHLMEHGQLFLRSKLKISDIAALLAINSRYVSECIKAHRACTFSEYINHYRIAYAKELMQAWPEKKIAAVAVESGFANEMSFFRCFKQIENMTPRQWMDNKL